MKISDRPVVERAAGDWEVTLVASEGSGAALYVQIAQAVVADIRRGRLTPGQRLPGTRTLAERLGVHRNTVLAAYAELRAEGWIESDPARQTFVCQALPEVPLSGKARTRSSRRASRAAGFP
ncbi:MAG TPA: winged helix-turn-helix domain-containing protein, partial [Polyangiaceae bacterium]|nr:winged helix-turn-helix domain-containing protein [Polyangiaceae bacterium]